MVASATNITALSHGEPFLFITRISGERVRYPRRVAAKPRHRSCSRMPAALDAVQISLR
jgi:hypothetical protein